MKLDFDSGGGYTYTYDEAGRRIVTNISYEIKGKDQNGNDYIDTKYTQKFTYEYDENNNLKKSNYETKRDYFNEKGELLSSSYSAKTTEEYEYDKNVIQNLAYIFQFGIRGNNPIIKSTRVSESSYNDGSKAKSESTYNYTNLTFNEQKYLTGYSLKSTYKTTYTAVDGTVTTYEGNDEELYKAAEEYECQ